ncbi:hypothetical protein VKS41_009157 [Umbelopsis sp. WA50703]
MSNGNAKLKGMSRIIGRMKTLHVRAQEAPSDTAPKPTVPDVRRLATFRSDPLLRSKSSKDKLGIKKSRTAGSELADIDVPVFIGDPDRFSPKLPDELWQIIFEKLDIVALFACHQINKQFRKVIRSSRLPTQLESPVWAPLALLLYTREKNWETGTVASLTKLKGLPSNDIGNMIFRYPYLVCTFLDDDSLRLWDLETGRTRLVCKLRGLRFSVIDMVVENNTLAAAIENSSVVKVFNLETGYTRDTYIHEADIGTVTALRAEQDIIVAGYSSGALVVWDPAGVMEGDATPQPSKVVAIDIYEPYIIALTDNGLIRVFNTNEEDPSSPKLIHVRSHVLPNLPPRAKVQFAQFTLSEMGPITLMAAVSEPLTSETPHGTIFNFHQDSLYHLYHLTWPFRHEDAPTLSPRVRIWNTNLPDHGVRWDTFEFINKSRAVVVETDTNTQAHDIRILDWDKVGKRKRTISKGLKCENDAKCQQLLDDMGIDGFVPIVGVSDDFMIVTGEWQCFFALNFAPKGLERLIQQLEG